MGNERTKLMLVLEIDFAYLKLNDWSCFLQ